MVTFTGADKASEMCQYHGAVVGGEGHGLKCISFEVAVPGKILPSLALVSRDHKQHRFKTI